MRGIRVRRRPWTMITGLAVWCGFFTMICAAITPAPCDKTRRVFTDQHGTISDGPSGTNYTKVYFTK